MATPTLDIDEIVRQVVAKLAAAGGVKADPSRSAATTAATPHSILGNVITTKQLAVVPRDATVQVTATAVITPAATDLAADRNIVIKRSCREASPATTTAALQICTHQIPQPTAALASLLEKDGIQVNLTDKACVMDAVGQSVAAVTNQGRRAVLLTAKVAVATCLANRTPNVRAVAVASVAELDAIAADVAPNLLITNPAGMGVAALRSLIHGFCQSTATEPAEPYRAIFNHPNELKPSRPLTPDH